MPKWPIRIGRATALGLGWGSAWMPVAVLVGQLIDPTDSMDEPWLVAGMLAGFPCGAVFSALTGIADGRRGLAELSIAWAGTRGLLSGLLVGGVWLAVALSSDPPKWLLEGSVIGSVTLLSGISGAGTAWLARIGKNKARAHAA